MAPDVLPSALPIIGKLGRRRPAPVMPERPYKFRAAGEKFESCMRTGSGRENCDQDILPFELLFELETLQSEEYLGLHCFV